MNIAEVSGLVGGKCSDSPLTPLGKEEARKLGGLLKKKGKQWDTVYSSSALRAATTAEIVLKEMNDNTQPIQLRSDLEEIDTGEWTLKPRTEVLQGVVYTRDTVLGGAESFADLEARVSRFVDELTALIQDPNNTKPKTVIAVFAHGMVIRAFCSVLLKVPSDVAMGFSVNNTSLSRFVCRQTRDGTWRWCLSRYNTTTHLQI